MALSTLLCLLTIVTYHPTYGELFTALAEMEELMDTESVLIANLENYVSVQESKLTQLRRYELMSN